MGILWIGLALLAPSFGGEEIAPPRPGVVLLRNGHVLSGTIRAETERTVVESGGATIRLKPSDVAFLGVDLREVYEHQRGRRDLTNARDCLSLAQWCLRNDLLDEAARELADARRIEPKHAHLNRLESQITARRDALARSKPAAPAVESPRSSADDLDRFVRGMRGELVEQFASQIQPLLLNNCATAGCHAPRSTQGFRLAAGSSSRPSRRLTLRNLQAVLSQIDRAQPTESPLLKQSLAAHGQLGAPIFSDADSYSYQRLSAWIAQLGARSEPPSDALPDAPTAGHLLGQSLNAPARGRVVPVQATEPLQPPVTQFPEGDPFDPAEFNEPQGP